MQDNTFVSEREAILMAAAELYQADQGNIFADQEVGRVTILNPVIGEDPRALRDAELHQARVDVAARAIARLAGLQDRRERGGFGGKVAALEIGLTKVAERAYLRDLGAVTTLVDWVRQGGETLPTVEEQQ